MSVSNETIILGIVLIFIYLVVYKNHKLLGNLGYTSVGIGLLFYSRTASTYDPYITGMAGLVILAGGITNTIIDILKKSKE